MPSPLDDVSVERCRHHAQNLVPFFRMGAPQLRGIKSIDSLVESVLTFEVLAAHTRTVDGVKPYNMLMFGNWSELTRMAGLDPNTDIVSVHTIVMAQAHGRFRFPDGQIGTMLSYRYALQEPAWVLLTLGPPLLIDYHR